MNIDTISAGLGSLWTIGPMALFFGIVAFACWPGNRQRFEEAARIPLRKDGWEG